jgi:hypothetical protein
MGGGEELRQGGFDFIAKINVNAGGGVGFLFHAAEIKPGNAGASEKIYETMPPSGTPGRCLNKPQQCRDFPNRWNFPGSEKDCRAIPIELDPETHDRRRAETG